MSSGTPKPTPKPAPSCVLMLDSLDKEVAFEHAAPAVATMYIRTAIGFGVYTELVPVAAEVGALVEDLEEEVIPNAAHSRRSS